jgi:hypothetical protein
MPKKDNRVVNFDLHGEFIAKGYRHTYHPAEPDDGRPAFDEYENDEEAVLVDAEGSVEYMNKGSAQ